MSQNNKLSSFELNDKILLLLNMVFEKVSNLLHDYKINIRKQYQNFTKYEKFAFFHCCYLILYAVSVCAAKYPNK